MKKFLSRMMPSPSCEEITKENFSSKIRDENAIVEFYASWCTSCDTLEKNLLEINPKKLGVEVFKVNIENQRELAQMYNIRTLPTLMYLKNGKLIETEIGTKTPSEIIQRIEQNFY